MENIRSSVGSGFQVRHDRHVRSSSLLDGMSVTSATYQGRLSCPQSLLRDPQISRIVLDANQHGHIRKDQISQLKELGVSPDDVDLICQDISQNRGRLEGGVGGKLIWGGAGLIGLGFGAAVGGAAMVNEGLRQQNEDKVRGAEKTYEYAERGQATSSSTKKDEMFEKIKADAAKAKDEKYVSFGDAAKEGAKLAKTGSEFAGKLNKK